MFRRFNDLNSSYAHLRMTRQRQRLWTILHFGVGRYYVFTSTADPGGQMFNISRNILTMSGHYGKGKPHGRDLATDMADFFMQRVAATGMAHPGRHAEEWMIDHFDTVLADAQAANGGVKPTQAIILNSDSPCSPQDSHPSSNLAGWPASCTRKLARLANDHTDVDFSVFYMRRFGASANFTTQQIARGFQQESRALGGNGRIAIYPYTADMMQQAAPFQPL